MNLFNEFKENNPQDFFYTTKRDEDMSTIYHGECDSSDPSNNYWCYPPAGFAGNYDALMAFFGKGVSLLIAVDVENQQYVPLLSDKSTLHKTLEFSDVVIGQPIPEKDLRFLINVIANS